MRRWSTMLGALTLAVVAVVVPSGAATATAATVIAEPDTVAVPEATSASFTVRLSEAPPTTVFLGISMRGSGLWASPPVNLVFTPTNWSTPQSYSVYSVPDPDAVDDTAKFTLSAPGYVSDTVVLVQLDDD